MVVVHLADHDRRAHLRARVHDPLDHLHRVGAEPTVDDQLDRRVRARRPARRRGHVRVRTQQLLDERAGVLRDVMAAVDDLGHGGHRHAGRRGDLRERGSSGLPPAGRHTRSGQGASSGLGA
jgi:hypothetical protein